MPKEFYTERDIEDMFKRGILSLEMNDNVVLTGLAYEKAQRLGIKLAADKPPAPPEAPMRPYVARNLAAQPAVRGTIASPGGGETRSQGECACAAARPGSEKSLHERIRTGVVNRIGTQVDPALLDVIIRRVIAGTGVK